MIVTTILLSGFVGSLLMAGAWIWWNFRVAKKEAVIVQAVKEEIHVESKKIDDSNLSDLVNAANDRNGIGKP